jgi:hypothetical protein
MCDTYITEINIVAGMSVELIKSLLGDFLVVNYILHPDMVIEYDLY